MKSVTSLTRDAIADDLMTGTVLTSSYYCNGCRLTHELIQAVVSNTSVQDCEQLFKEKYPAEDKDYSTVMRLFHLYCRMDEERVIQPVGTMQEYVTYNPPTEEEKVCAKNKEGIRKFSVKKHLLFQEKIVHLRPKGRH